MQGRLGRVLLVEDDNALRNAVTSIAKNSGYQVTAVADGQAAVQALQASGFDLILLDIGLPLLDGGNWGGPGLDGSPLTVL